MAGMKILADSREETVSVAEGFLAGLKPGAKASPDGSRQATVVALHGDLGAGKTTFTQGLAWALGVEEVVTSPTFVIEKIYKLNDQAKFKHLVHIDAYRLEQASELDHLGFSDLLNDPSNLIVLEWPERVKDILPAETVTVNFRFIDENTREIVYED